MLGHPAVVPCGLAKVSDYVPADFQAETAAQLCAAFLIGRPTPPRAALFDRRSHRRRCTVVGTTAEPRITTGSTMLLISAIRDPADPTRTRTGVNYLMLPVVSLGTRCRSSSLAAMLNPAASGGDA